MKAADFVLATLSHFVRRAEGPWPGMPARVGARGDARFETALASICVHQEISQVIHRALSAQALGPGISPVTMGRLSDHRHALAECNTMRIHRLGGLLGAVGEAGVPVLVMGDALSHLTLYEPAVMCGEPAAERDAPRAVGQLELLVEESRLDDALRVLHSAGFSGRRSDPSFGARAGVVGFHHYVAPLVLWNGEGDRLRLRFRVFDVGHPERADHAWGHSRVVKAWDREERAVSLEDHLLDLVVRLGISGCADLAALGDVGLILAHHAGDVEWGYVAFRARSHGVYSAVWHALRHVRRSLDLRTADPLDPPAAFYQKWLDLFCDPESIDYVRSSEKRQRFFFGLVSCGGLASKLRWLWHHCVPRREWVECVAGDSSSLWSWVRYHSIVHDNSRARREARRRALLERGNVTRIDGKD